MSILTLLLLLVVLGVVWYLVDRYVLVHVAAPVRVVVTVIAVLALCAFLLDGFGVVDLGARHFRWRG